MKRLERQRNVHNRDLSKEIQVRVLEKLVFKKVVLSYSRS